MANEIVLAQAETDSLLDLDALARALALFERERVPRDVLLSDLTGQVIDVRRIDPEHGLSRSEQEASRIAEALAVAASGAEVDL